MYLDKNAARMRKIDMERAEILLIAISLKQDYILTKYYYRLPSLGIGYLAAVLEKKGIGVSLIDRTISKGEVSSLAHEIVAKRPRVAGFYCISETYKTVVEIVKIIKDKDPSIVTMIGGPHVYGMPEESMADSAIDYGFRGEAEDEILHFLNALGSASGFENVQGLVYRRDGWVMMNPLALVKDLDSIPFPARHLYPPLGMYRPSILAYKRLPATGILTSRGCAHRCIFCHSGKGHFKLRFHSAGYVLDEMMLLKKDFGIRELIIFDDTFLIDKERARKVCEGMIERHLDMTWSCNARINDLDKDLLVLLKKAGCWLVQLCIESGTQKILDGIKKGITLEEAQKACRIAYEAGIQVKAYFILGHPGETVETLNDTISFMKRIPAHYASINFMTPFPGTQLWEDVQKYGHFDKKKLEAINYLSDKPTFVPYGLTEEILMKKFQEAYLQFYLNPKTILRNIGALRDMESFKKIGIAGKILGAMALSRMTSRKKADEKCPKVL